MIQNHIKMFLFLFSFYIATKHRSTGSRGLSITVLRNPGGSNHLLPAFALHPNFDLVNEGVISLLFTKLRISLNRDSVWYKYD